ncbi:MAG: hypothetical protein JW717_02365 [Marinilabiliaceae bacterium]|nr:hypothetical protein [Marinilabiliaceae bacterium]
MSNYLLKHPFIKTLSLLFSFLFILFNTIANEPFTISEQVLLYHTASKSPVVWDECKTCFIFDSLLKDSFNVRKYDYKLIEQLLTSDIGILSIDWNKLKNKRFSALTELATKYSILKLNEDLKKELNNKSKNKSELHTLLYNKLIPGLPEKIKEKTKSKKTTEIIQCIIHPSFPVKQKIEILSKLGLEPKEQQKLLNTWSEILVNYLYEQSNNTYKKIKDTTTTFDIRMLAAGEGSGTIGLLYEYEQNPEDSSKNWYGKATGLFTYKYDIKHGKTYPLEQTTTQLQIPANKNIAIHISLWGLNSTTKPMIIFQKANKTYHLYAPEKLTPDSTMGKGLTHIDRIGQLKKLKVEKPYEKLYEKDGLYSIIKRELVLKDKIEQDIHRHEAGIDSIQKSGITNQSQINYHKTQINIYLTNLTAKESRIAELTTKLSKELKEIEKAQESIIKMEQFLGKNIQTWKKKDSLYLFADGTIFNYKTQDLVFKAKNKSEKIDIRLVSPSLIISGQLKDEIQMIVTLSDADYPVQNNSVIEHKSTYYYAKDEFITNTISHIENKNIHTYQVKLKIDTLFLNRKIDQLSNSICNTMRHSTVSIKIINDTAKITIISGCDPQRTKLSALTVKNRKKLKINGYSKKNNLYLAALRSLYTLKQLGLNDINIPIDYDHLLNYIYSHDLEILKSIVNFKDI